MTEKYIDLASEIIRMRDAFEMKVGIVSTLNWLDDHPGQVPGRTVTDSEYDDAAKKAKAASDVPYWNGRALLYHLGIKIVADPEPTNAEKLAEALRQTNPAHGSDLHDIKGLSEALDKAGVKAPGGGR